jgi:REP element-mobilizing transposase RayT
MPRRARIDAPGALHHVIVRGIERKAIFKGDFDKTDFLERLDHILSASSTPCYAWALMTNHVHLLIRTGMVPLATLMRRLLTGYAVSFNRRHRRHGQLFQNRYKSILCQEDAYLMELTRYIHLNPLRVGMVRNMKSLDTYRYTGHAALIGKQVVLWQDTDKILGLFAAKKAVARRKYRDFVDKGVELGRRPELVGGGLVRSMGGWKQAKKMIKGRQRFKGDERILGDSDFVLDVLARCDEQLERSYQLSAKGVDVAALSSHVAELFDLTPDQLLTPGRYPAVVRARSLLCYWAVRELGVTATDLAKQIGMTQPAISISVKRGEKIAKETEFSIESLLG